MRGCQPARDLHCVFQSFAHGNRALAQALAQRLALKKFRDEIELPLMITDVVNSEHIRVVQRTGSFRLLLEALSPRGIRSHMGMQHLDRDKPFEPAVTSQVNFTHSPLTQGIEDLVRSYTDPGEEGHNVARVDILTPSLLRDCGAPILSLPSPHGKKPPGSLQ
jgi:hypothetical protein